MSIRDPYITSFKGSLLNLQQYQKPIKDNHPDLQPFCEALENILRKGLKNGYSLFGLYKRDYWSWIESIGPYLLPEKPCPFYSIAVETCKSYPKIKTSQGRGRLFLRIALNKKFLTSVIKSLIRDDQLLDSWYDRGASILGNELLVESFMSLLFLLSDIKFELNYKNASFLDETWALPIIRQYQLVPSPTLGVKVHYVQGKCIVCGVMPGGVAADENKIEMGDVIDEMFGENLQGGHRGKVMTLLQEHQGWPIYITVLKCRMSSGQIFPALKQRFIQLRKEFPSFDIPTDTVITLPPRGSIQEKSFEEMQSLTGSIFYRVKYIGKTGTGEEGGTVVIERAVLEVLRNTEKQVLPREEYIMELAETNIITTHSETKDLLFKHCYPDISSCGRRTDSVEFFAYVAGDTTCSISKNFECFVFQAKSGDESKVILRSIADGFGRTSWAV